MEQTYKSGGILQVLHSGKTKTDVKKDHEDDDDGSGDHLMNLFTKSLETEAVGNQDAVEENVVNTNIDVDTDLEQDDGKNAKKVKEDESSVKLKKEKQIESPERLERTLFVGNVSINVTKKILKKLFTKFGEIETLRFRSFAPADIKLPKKVAIIKKNFHTECKSLNAYVVYKNKESIGKALSCNGMVLEGLHLRVDKACPEKEYKNKNSLFIGNLPFNISDEDVYKHFEQCGTVDYVRLIRDKATGVGKGFGYVSFKNADGYVFGLKLNGSKLNGRALRVNRIENSTKNQKHSNNQNQNQNRKGNQQFCGLKSTTSMKDRVKGKKLVQEKIRTSTNAQRRLKNKTGGGGKKKVKNVKYNHKIAKKLPKKN